jgi:ACS family glucarate transporter-like MFS transporter
MDQPTRPTFVRYAVVVLTTVVAILLYLDRFCLGFVTPYIKDNLGLSDGERDFLLGAFFYTYAFGQIPCGWLSDRYGPRLMLSLYLAIWSTLTGLMGLATSFGALLLFRFGCGLFESGAYPACAGLIRRWVPKDQRGLASGVVSIGGRIGGAVAPVLTAYLMVLFMPVSTPSYLSARDLLHPVKFAADLTQKDRRKMPELSKKLAPVVLQALSTPERKLAKELAESETPDAEQVESLVRGLNTLLVQPDWGANLDRTPFEPKLSKQALELFAKEAPTTDEVARRNRLLLEVAFPDQVRRLAGDSWQPVMMIYGAFGVLLAVFFFAFFRNQPREHPLCNEAEAKLVEGSHAESTEPLAEAPPVPAGVLWRGIFTSPSLWLSAFVQFGTNFGWIFIGSLLPTYLLAVHQVPDQERGWMASVPFLVSLPMMIVGGAWTDWMTKRFGPKLGRSFPLGVTRMVAAGAFVACYLLDSAWGVVGALCVFSVASDMGLPAVWAYCLDVGGRNVGMVLGWGNMWGNLGAAIAPTALGWILLNYVDDKVAGYRMVFLTCAAVFFVIGVASFFIDATRPIVKADAEPVAVKA